LANKLWIKVADLTALHGDHYKAIELYEKVAQASINNNLMHYLVKDYLLKAGICHLATGDAIGTARALENYRGLDPGFEQQREYTLLVDLLHTIEDLDAVAFTVKRYAYEQMNRFDRWKTDMLGKVKVSIEAAAEDDNEFA
ncbi:soluble NSF attachment protein, partial [Dactylonectria macrodidyma]